MKRTVKMYAWVSPEENRVFAVARYKRLVIARHHRAFLPRDIVVPVTVAYEAPTPAKKKRAKARRTNP